MSHYKYIREAPLVQRDCATRNVSWSHANCWTTVQ